MTNPKYGPEHRALRRELLPSAYGQPCHLCGLLMLPGHKLDLDHTPDGAGYRGFTHAHCNRSDGARRGNKRRKTTMPLIKCALAVEVAEDRLHTAVVVAGDDGGFVRIELAEYLPGSQVGVAAVQELRESREVVAVAVDPKSPAATLLEPLKKARIRVAELSASDVAVASGEFIDLLRSGELRHDGSQILGDAVRHITARPLAGQVAVERRGHDVDVSPASAAVLAVWAWRHAPRPKKAVIVAGGRPGIGQSSPDPASDRQGSQGSPDASLARQDS
ncbi:MAG: hypothetical protein ACRDPQ_03535 [Nocardioidaceae bacterium]